MKSLGRGEIVKKAMWLYPKVSGFSPFERWDHSTCCYNGVVYKFGTETSEACSENLRYVKHWHTPILAMTADVIQETHEKCMKCGMDGYVSKPFEEEQFYNAVMHFFESEQSSPSHET